MFQESRDEWKYRSQGVSIFSDVSNNEKLILTILNRRPLDINVRRQKIPNDLSRLSSSIECTVKNLWRKMQSLLKYRQGFPIPSEDTSWRFFLDVVSNKFLVPGSFTCQRLIPSTSGSSKSRQVSNFLMSRATHCFALMKFRSIGLLR